MPLASVLKNLRGLYKHMFRSVELALFVCACTKIGKRPTRSGSVLDLAEQTEAFIQSRLCALEVARKLRTARDQSTKPR
jgi:hypothetical protein